MTKFVLANIKTIEAVKFAPLLKRLLANALAAYEHDELTIPKNVAFISVAAESSPRDCRMRLDYARECKSKDECPEGFKEHPPAT